jgi:hypothetical protein
VSVTYRYEQPGRPNFFVIDKTSLKVVKKAQIEAPSTLIVEGSQLLACDCLENKQGCKAVNPVAAKAVDAPDKICVRAGEKRDCSVVDFQSDQAGTGRFVASTKDYVVARASWDKDAPYLFYPRVPDGKPMSVQLSPHDLLDWPIAITGNEILVSERIREDEIFKLVSVPTGVTKTLFGLPTSPNVRMSVLLLHNQTLFVGLGRDLLIFDIKSNTLQRYIKNLIPAELKSGREKFDNFRIGRLMIYRGRLIALTLYGENSRIVPLSSLLVTDK